MPRKVQPGDDFEASPIWEASFQNKLIDLVNAFDLGLLLNRPNSPNTHGDDNNLIKIKNSTGAHLEMGDAVRYGDYLLNTEEPKQRWYDAVAISTTFDVRIAIAAGPIPTGEYGDAYISGICPVHYTGTAPSVGDWLGPKPSQAVLEKGFPAFARVTAIVDSGTPKLAQCRLHEITTLLCKTTGAITGGTTPTQAYQIWVGTLGSETNGGWTTVPDALSRVDIDSGKFVKLTFANNGWIMEALQCNG